MINLISFDEAKEKGLVSAHLDNEENLLLLLFPSGECVAFNIDVYSEEAAGIDCQPVNASRKIEMHKKEFFDRFSSIDLEDIIDGGFVTRDACKAWTAEKSRQWQEKQAKDQAKLEEKERKEFERLKEKYGA